MDYLKVEHRAAGQVVVDEDGFYDTQSGRATLIYDGKIEFQGLTLREIGELEARIRGFQDRFRH